MVRLQKGIITKGGIVVSYPRAEVAAAEDDLLAALIALPESPVIVNAIHLRYLLNHWIDGSGGDVQTQMTTKALTAQMVDALDLMHVSINNAYNAVGVWGKIQPVKIAGYARRAFAVRDGIAEKEDSAK